MSARATYDQVMILPSPGYPTPPQPRRNLLGLWVFAGLVTAGLVVAGAIIATRGGSSSAPAQDATVSTSAACMAWRDAQPRLVTVPTPTGGDWRPTSPGGLAVVTAWSEALTPILDDLDRVARSGGPASDRLRRYVTAQRDGLAAAWAGQYGPSQIGEVKASRMALDDACGT